MSKIVFICHANYCRSPVAEKIFNKIDNSLNATSYAIEYFRLHDMDKRSADFLRQIEINPLPHVPKKIERSVLANAEYIFAMDLKILMYLHKNFSTFAKKIKLINFFDKELNIIDPINFDNSDDYIEVMNRIRKCVKYIHKNVY